LVKMFVLQKGYDDKQSYIFIVLQLSCTKITSVRYRKATMYHRHKHANEQSQDLRVTDIDCSAGRTC
jgi:hypothetical protein